MKPPGYVKRKAADTALPKRYVIALSGVPVFPGFVFHW